MVSQCFRREICLRKKVEYILNLHDYNCKMDLIDPQIIVSFEPNYVGIEITHRIEKIYRVLPNPFMSDEIVIGTSIIYPSLGSMYFHINNMKITERTIFLSIPCTCMNVEIDLVDQLFVKIVEYNEEWFRERVPEFVNFLFERKRI